MVLQGGASSHTSGVASGWWSMGEVASTLTILFLYTLQVMLQGNLYITFKFKELWHDIDK